MSEPKIYKLGIATYVKNSKHSDYGDENKSTNTWFEVMHHFMRVLTEKTDKKRNNDPNKSIVIPSYVTQHLAKLYAITLEAS